MSDRTPTVGDTITTAEELDALPKGAVLRSSHLNRKSGLGRLIQAQGSDLYGVDGTYSLAIDADLPATVLHIPGQDPHADTERARSIAVALEQEVAILTTEWHRFAEDYARLYARLHAEAHAAHSVIEQVGLLQEALDGIGAGEMLRRILDGGTFEEVRNG